MKIAILGYGKQGQSAFDYWSKPGNEVTIHDSRPNIILPEGVQSRLGTNYLADLEYYDLVVRGAPTIHPNDILTANPNHPEILQKVTSSTNEFFKVCPAPIIAVTGTKGKGTTSTLITKILEAAGKRVHLGGNIGIPPLDLLKNKIENSDWVVLELANFQLIDLKYSPYIAVCLIVAPEHLDWHKDMYEYMTAKEQLFRHQTHENIAIYNARNTYSEEIAAASIGRKISYDVPPVDEEPLETNGSYVDGNHIYMRGKKICKTNDVALLGRHNLENVCAAIDATWDIINTDKIKPAKLIKKVVRGFVGLPHRIEIVKQVNHIWFINDSFATNPGATMAAIDAIQHPQVLIIGGFERGLPIADLAQKIKNTEKIRKVLVIGASGDRVARTLGASGYKNFVVSSSKTMDEIVKEAASYAKKNDAVVLSPSFASFDMFKDFEERGDLFKKAVQSL